MKFFSRMGQWASAVWLFVRLLFVAQTWRDGARWLWRGSVWCVLLPRTIWRWIKRTYQDRLRYSRSHLGRRPFLPPQLLFIPLMIVPAFMGFVAGLDNPFLVVLLAGLVFAVMVFVLMSTRGMLQVLFVLTFLVQGSIMYFAKFSKAPWLAVGMGGLLFFRALLEFTTYNRRDLKPLPQAGPVLFALLMFVACFFASTALNRPGASQIISSLKTTFPMFGVLAVLIWFKWDSLFLQRIWRLMLVVVVCQLPVVAYQHFFVAGKRAQGFDSVVGTFGGSEVAGGLSAVMVFFLICALGYALAAWHRKQLDRRWVIFIVLCIFANILLGEVKAGFVWIPVMCLMVLRQRVLKNVGTVIASGIVLAVVLGGVYVTYDALYWKNEKTQKAGTSEKLERTTSYFFDTRNIDYTTGEVSRGASIALWAEDRQASLPRRMIGYGPGASKSGSVLGKGEVARRFEPLAIDATTVAVLLWDLGVLGFTSYVGMMLGGIWVAWRFMRSGQGSERQRAIMDACFASLVLMLSKLIYNRSLTDEPTLQLLFLWILGCIVQIARFPEAPDAKVEAAPVKEPAPGRRRAFIPRPRRAAPLYPQRKRAGAQAH
ncbi:hypothetical protein V8J88_13115 [Massilia sp. W12]|uniref:hypothetical protein n=1 Tax=Massilia sp. W12 TaxID=3126507 RepID=UPI0030CB5346